MKAVVHVRVIEAAAGVKNSKKVIDKVERAFYNIYCNVSEVPRWWNWQTRYFEGVVGVMPVRVRVSLSAPIKKRIKPCKKGFIFYSTIEKCMACAPIAQLDRASDYGSEGWGFESSWARHLF